MTTRILKMIDRKYERYKRHFDLPIMEKAHTISFMGTSFSDSRLWL